MARGVDVVTRIEIERPREAVAAYAMDPDHAPQWYENIESVQWQSAPPLALGSRIAFVAHFLGRRLAYVYEVVELEANERLAMQTAQGSLAMRTSYDFEALGASRTRMTLRNQGAPAGFSRLLAPFVAPAMGRANRKDLQRLKRLLEAA
jgi:uncharacterized membrane protein